jgi:hypothetical protein
LIAAADELEAVSPLYYKGKYPWISS